MAYVRQTALPAKEPVSVADAKAFMKIGGSDDDLFIGELIQAAREYGEAASGRSLAQRTFVKALDSFPYYTDTIQSQLAYPPSYYSLPRYSTTLWNYSQMIKLDYPPVISVQGIKYIDTNGNQQTLNQDSDFIFDRTTEEARIFPIPGQYWPACLYVPNAVEINFTAGYDSNPAKTDTYSISGSLIPPDQQPSSTIVSGIPQMYRAAILMLVAHWYDHRWAASAEGLREIPHSFSALFGANAVYDFAPTRG